MQSSKKRFSNDRRERGSRFKNPTRHGPRDTSMHLRERDLAYEITSTRKIGKVDSEWNALPRLQSGVNVRRDEPSHLPTYLRVAENLRRVT